VASIAVAVPESRLTPKLQAALVKSLKSVRKRFSTLSD
jgi:hypothetical protein